MPQKKPEKYIILNIIFSTIGLFLNIGINMGLTPYITENIGVKEYGYINLANTIVGYVEIISVALNSLAARYIAIDYHRGNTEAANSCFNSILVANLGLAAILMLITGCGIWHIESLIDVPEELIRDVQILFLLVAVNYSVTMLGTVYNVAAFIHNRMGLIAFYKDISYLLKVISLIVFFSFLTPHIWYVTVAVLISTVFVFVMNVGLTKKITPELKINVKTFHLTTVYEIARNGIWNSISSLGVTLNSGLDLIITNKMLSTIAMGQLSICKSLVTIFNSFVSVFTQAFRPVQLNAYAHNDSLKMIRLFNISIKVTGFICTLLFAGVVAVGKDFLQLWVPSQNIGLLYNVILIIIIGDVMGAITYPLLYVFTIVKRLKAVSLINVANGLINVISMILLLRYTNLGIYAIVITTAVLNIIVQIFITPLLASSYLKISLFSFYPSVIRCITCGLIMSVCFVGVSKLLAWEVTWCHLVFKIVILTVIGMLVSLIVLFSAKERREIVSFVNRKCERLFKRNFNP